MHKAGFVNIFGLPNVGKSTLLNTFLEDELVVTTPKPQTTRHRIVGILNSANTQIVFSDTPGYIEDPAYEMQEVMQSYALSVKKDADILIYMASLKESPEQHKSLMSKIRKKDVPLLPVLNKMDELPRDERKEKSRLWKQSLPEDEVYPISALHQKGTVALLEKIRSFLPEHPPFFPKDQMSDRSVRFFISEIIRKNIMLQFHEEVPYSVEVEVMGYQWDDETDPPLVRIAADIYVMRESQKGIIIGKGGRAIKSLGTSSRKEIQKFLGEKVFLDLRVKTQKNWRDNPGLLSKFGYDR